MDYKQHFKNISKNLPHGDSDYYTHCFGVYDILKSINADTNVCKAGLYHSIYDSEYFSAENNVTREEIIKLIGSEAEDLVYRFCNIKNRFNVILTNSFKFPPEIDKSLTQIEYANLKEQYLRSKNNQLIDMCDALLNKLSFYNNTFEQHKIDNKDLFVFDNLLNSSEIEYINQYCLNSLYKPEHSSNEMNYELDSRFVSVMSPDELENSNLLVTIKKISNILNQDLYIGFQYINHYTLNTSVSKHTDSSNSGQYTILIYPNKYWEDTWGGEIAFYDNSKINKMLDFVPGRVLVFDSRIEHKVMPLTRNSRRDRYSIALKCCVESGLDNFNKAYKVHTKVERENV